MKTSVDSYSRRAFASIPTIHLPTNQGFTVQRIALALIALFAFAGCSNDADVVETTTTDTADALVTTTSTTAATTQPEQTDEAELVTHTSPLGFSMDFPSEWRVEETDEIVTFFSPADGGDTFSEFVEVYTLDAADLELTDPTPAEVMQLLAADIILSGDYGDAEIFEEGIDITDGEESYGVAMQGTSGETVYTLAYSATIYNGTIYIIGFQATDEVNEYIDAFVAMADSFAFTD